MNAPTPPILPVLPDAAGATPVMAQYFEAKARQPDALVFFRMGDFYELFFEDAGKAVGRPRHRAHRPRQARRRSRSPWPACRCTRPRPISPS